MVLHLLNQFAHRSKLLDTLVVIMVNANLLKGVVSMAILWGLWFQANDEVAGAKTAARVAYQVQLTRSGGVEA